jgi:hypothetical protein
VSVSALFAAFSLPVLAVQYVRMYTVAFEIGFSPEHSMILILAAQFPVN